MKLNKITCCTLTNTDVTKNEATFKICESEFTHEYIFKNINSNKAYNIIFNMIGVELLTRIDDTAAVFIIDPDYAYDITEELRNKIQVLKHASN